MTTSHFSKLSARDSRTLLDVGAMKALRVID
jgi:hypothetical protein